MNEAIEKLQGFFSDMTIWEIEAGEAFSPGSPLPDTLRKRLAEIQVQYCTKGAKVRSVKFSQPPTYSSVTIENIESIDDDRILVKSIDKRGGLSDRYEYVLIKKNGEWRLAERVYVSFEGKRNQVYL